MGSQWPGGDPIIVARADFLLSPVGRVCVTGGESFDVHTCQAQEQAQLGQPPLVFLSLVPTRAITVSRAEERSLSGFPFALAAGSSPSHPGWEPEGKGGCWGVSGGS